MIGDYWPFVPGGQRAGEDFTPRNRYGVPLANNELNRWPELHYDFPDPDDWTEAENENQCDCPAISANGKDPCCAYLGVYPLGTLPANLLITFSGIQYSNECRRKALGFGHLWTKDYVLSIDPNSVFILPPTGCGGYSGTIGTIEMDWYFTSNCNPGDLGGVAHKTGSITLQVVCNEFSLSAFMTWHIDDLHYGIFTGSSATNYLTIASNIPDSGDNNHYGGVCTVEVAPPEIPYYLDERVCRLYPNFVPIL